MKKHDIDLMRRMRLKGDSLEKIGRKSGLTRERVRQLLAENYGEALSSARGTLEYVRNEVMDYQWDAGNASANALMIARRILGTLAGKKKLKVTKDDPLLALFKD